MVKTIVAGSIILLMIFFVIMFCNIADSTTGIQSVYEVKAYTNNEVRIVDIDSGKSYRPIKYNMVIYHPKVYMINYTNIFGFRCSKFSIYSNCSIFNANSLEERMPEVILYSEVVK
jgi:hypothetical protein